MGNKGKRKILESWDLQQLDSVDVGEILLELTEHLGLQIVYTTYGDGCYHNLSVEKKEAESHE